MSIGTKKIILLNLTSNQCSFAEQLIFETMEHIIDDKEGDAIVGTIQK